MISYVKGILAEKAKDRIVVESGMMGIGIFVPMSVLEVLPPLGEEVKIYTHLQVREDDMSLYGFLSRSDLEMFRQLLGVNGIGPKGALGILSALRPEDLRLAVMTGDAKAISRAPGVGAKTAQRIILDLKDKVQAEDLLTPLLDGSAAVSPAAGNGLSGNAVKEAVEALVALGYTNAEAVKAVKSANVSWLMEKHPELRLAFSISCTSRQPRGTERDGVEYFFVTPEAFRAKIERDEFLEYEEVYEDRFYGTLKAQVEAQAERGENVVFDVDVKGGCNIKRHYGQRALSIFIQPPSVEVLRERLVGRATDTPEAIEQRIAKAEYELTFAPQFDHCVVNDDLATAEQEVYNLVRRFLDE